MFQPQSESIYYDIVKLNKKSRNNYLNNFFTDKNLYSQLKFIIYITFLSDIYNFIFL